ncbi:MAG: hypothetical protein V3T17_02980 [Pseudomonadales bacterium]
MVRKTPAEPISFARPDSGWISWLTVAQLHQCKLHGVLKFSGSVAFIVKEIENCYQKMLTERLRA